MKRTAAVPTCLTLAVLLSTASPGCDGDGPPAASAADLTAYCDAYCGWRDRCSKPKTDCRPGCEAEAQQSFFNYRATFVQDLAACFKTTTSCGSDDACYSSAILKAAPAYQTDPAFTRCMQTRSACQQADKPSFSDDYCPQVLVLIDSVQASFLACLDRPCEQISGCLKAVLGE